ncbi:MAG: hypothetical protein WKF45_01240 [Ilumatobacteraceae bacterium]
MAVPVADGSARLGDAMRALAERGVVVDDVGLRRPTLDEVFLALTGHAPDSEADIAHDDVHDHQPTATAA